MKLSCANDQFLDIKTTNNLTPLILSFLKNNNKQNNQENNQKNEQRNERTNHSSSSIPPVAARHNDSSICCWLSYHDRLWIWPTYLFLRIWIFKKFCVCLFKRNRITNLDMEQQILEVEPILEEEPNPVVVVLIKK